MMLARTINKPAGLGGDTVPWNIHKNMRREVAQSLQEGRKMARSVENLADSLRPLCDGPEADGLARISDKMQSVISQLSLLYQSIAPKAFGQDESV
jgi:hypothetical protein